MGRSAPKPALLGGLPDSAWLPRKPSVGRACWKHSMCRVCGNPVCVNVLGTACVERVEHAGSRRECRCEPPRFLRTQVLRDNGEAIHLCPELCLDAAKIRS